MTSKPVKPIRRISFEEGLMEVFLERSKLDSPAREQTISQGQARECTTLTLLFQQMRKLSADVAKYPMAETHMREKEAYADFVKVDTDSNLCEIFKNYASDKTSERIYTLITSGCMAGESLKRQMLYVALSENPRTIKEYKDLPTSYLSDTVKALYEAREPNV